jgi:uncharacterized membrane protein
MVMGLLRLLKGELISEVRQWVEDGVIDRPQGEQILSRYDTSLEDQAHQSFGYSMLIGLAIFSMGLALLLLISHNWDEIPRAFRMLALVTLTLSLNGWGIRCMAIGQAQLGRRWLFAGAISYGASIMLIAQIYHLGEHFPDGIFWWALGVLPVALLTASRLLHLLVWSLATLWFFAEARYGMPWFYPFFLLALAWQLWRGTPSRVLAAVLIWGATLWLHCLYNVSHSFFLSEPLGRHDVLDFTQGHLVVDVALGLLIYALSQVLATRGSAWWRDTATIINLWMLRGALLFLFIFSYQEIWGEVVGRLGRYSDAFWYLLAADVVLLALAPFISLPRQISVGLAALTVNGLLLSAWLWRLDSIELVLAVTANLILLVSGIRLILRGVEIHAGYLFYTGVTVILLQAVLRYLDVMGDYITGAVLFLIAGGILFMAARFWRRVSHNKSIEESRYE